MMFSVLSIILHVTCVCVCVCLYTYIYIYEVLCQRVKGHKINSVLLSYTLLRKNCTWIWTHEIFAGYFICSIIGYN